MVQKIGNEFAERAVERLRDSNVTEKLRHEPIIRPILESIVPTAVETGVSCRIDQLAKVLAEVDTE